MIPILKSKIMNFKIFIVFVLMGVSSLLVAQPADVQVKKKAMLDQKAARMHQMKSQADGLNLTADQKESFKKGMMAIHKQMQPLRNELGEAEAHQKTLATAEKPDLNAINKNIEKIGGIKVEMAKILAKQRLEMRAQLTDEQRMKFDMMRDKRMMDKGPKGMKGPKGGKPHKGLK
jgi:Spy/CpxP family protein refolding chaperone